MGDGRLVGAVHGVGRVPAQALDRRDVDDRTRTSFDHGREEGPRAGEDVQHVDGVQGVPVGCVAVDERPRPQVVAHVVDEDVGTAVLLDDAGRQPLDIVLLRHVDDDGVGAVAGGADALDVVLGPLLVDLGDDDVGAGCGERAGGCPTDAASSAGYDRDLAGEIDLSRHPAPILVLDILCDPWSRPRARHGRTSRGWPEGAAATRRRS